MPRQSPPPSGTRYTRRWFLVIGGAFVAAVIGVYELFLRGGSPGGGATKSISNLFADFPLNNVEDVPHKTWDQWSIRVDGLVDAPMTIDGAAWKALPRYEETVDFHCVEGWSVGNVRWGGVRPATVLDKAGAAARGQVRRLPRIHRRVRGFAADGAGERPADGARRHARRPAAAGRSRRAASGWPSPSSSATRA